MIVYLLLLTEPIEKRCSFILLHDNFDTRGNYSEAWNNIICKLIHLLGDVGVRYFGASFGGDKVSVKTSCKGFHGGVTAELSLWRTFALIKYCRNY